MRSRRRPRLTASSALTALWARLGPAVAAALVLFASAAVVPGTVQPVAAECTQIRPPASVPFEITTAFTATVADVVLVHDDQAEAAGEGDGSAWTVTLDVERRYIGEAPDAVTWTGHTLLHLVCNQDVLGGELEVGQQLFVAAEGRPMGSGNAGGRTLLWHRVDGKWRFYDEALQQEDRDGPPYPAAARDASTTAQILAILARLPDTATAPGPASAQSWSPALIVGGLVVVFVAVGVRRWGRRHAR